jgi:hypothetical protein
MGTIEKDRVLQTRGKDLCHREGDKIGSVGGRRADRA